MPAKKSTTHEAAQNKVRKAEIRTLQKARAHVISCFKAEEREQGRQVHLLLKAAVKADKAYQSAYAKFEKAVAKMDKSKTRDLKQIDRSIAILNGRVGAG